MASTLTAVDIFGLYDGFFNGVGGSLTPELLTGETDNILITGFTANRISWEVIGDQVSALSGLTHLKVDGTDYAVTSGPTYNGGSGNTETEFGPISDLTPGTYTVELVGLGGGGPVEGDIAATESGADAAAISGTVSIPLLAGFILLEDGTSRLLLEDNSRLTFEGGGGSLAVTGTLTATETGVDTAAIVGRVAVDRKSVV